MIKSQKGYYPQGGDMHAPDGRVDKYSGEIYILSTDVYRAILLGE